MNALMQNSLNLIRAFWRNMHVCEHQQYRSWGSIDAEEAPDGNFLEIFCPQFLTLWVRFEYVMTTSPIRHLINETMKRIMSCINGNSTFEHKYMLVPLRSIFNITFSRLHKCTHVYTL